MFSTELILIFYGQPYVIFTEIVSDLSQLQNYREPWDKLARTAAEPNAFFESWMLLPALQELAQQQVHIVITWESEARQQMLGLLPVVQECSYRGLPIKRTVVWRHAYCFLCTPLIAAGQVDTVVRNMLDTIQAAPGLASLVSLQWQLKDNSISRCFEHNPELAAWRVGKLSEVARAALLVPTDCVDGEPLGLSAKKKKELRRNKNRLGDLGKLDVKFIDQNCDPETVKSSVDNFFALENRGWKKEGGTSILSDPAHQRFFEQSMHVGTLAGASWLVEILLDDVPIASLIMIAASVAGHSYTVKLAVDADYKKYSLGSLLMLEATKLSCAQKQNLKQIDSCAASDHPMINRLWRSRVAVVNLHLAPSGDYRRVLFYLSDIASVLYKKLRG